MKAIRVAVAVHPLVMVANNSCDLGVVLNPGKNALANHRMLLHPATLIERERAWFLQQPCGESDLADVVHEPAEMGELLLLLR